MPATTPSPLADLVQELDLKGSRGSLLWGARRGFPLGITFTDGSEQTDALIQLRYASHEFAAGEQPELVFAEPLPRLMDEGWAEVEIRDDLAWLTLKRLGDRLDRQEVVPAIDAVIGCLENLGIAAVATCHYCDSAEGVTVLASKGRVGQICAQCIEDQIGKDVKQLGFSARSLGPLALLAPIVIGLQALLWGLLWTGVDRFFEWQGGEVRVNFYIAGLVVVFLAGVAACPAFLFRFVSNRGNRRAGLLAGAGALAALFFGEIVHLCFAWGTVLIVGPLLTQPNLVLEVLLLDGGLFLILKLFTMAAFLGFAASWAKPREIALEL